MNIFRLSAAAVAVSVLLSACATSSGGGQSSAVGEGYTTTNPYQKTTEVSASTVNDTLSVLNKVQFDGHLTNGLSGALVSPKSDGSVTTDILKNVSNEEIDTLWLGETAFVLLGRYRDRQSLGANITGFRAFTDNDVIEGSASGTVSGYVGGNPGTRSGDTTYFENMRFGVLNVGGTSTLFVQGYKTPVDRAYHNGTRELIKMPTSGKFTYHSGSALYGKDGTYQSLQADVTADFSDKRIDVGLKESDASAYKVAFSAKIDGNNFSGKSNGIESSGAFYGSEAHDVGGVFYQTEGSEKGYNGVFGATDKR